MGEDAQLEEPDEGYGLSPAHDESLQFDEETGAWVCSIDGSCVASKGRLREQYELEPCSEISVPEEQVLRSAVSVESTAMFHGMIFDDSHAVLRNVSKRQHSLKYGNNVPSASAIQLPQPLDASLKKRRTPKIASKTHQKSLGPRREISPIARVSSIDSLQKLTSGSTQIYNPLRRTTSQISMSTENGFSAELKSQGDKLINGLKAILRERIAQENRRGISCSSDPSTVVTALSRTGSTSTVSTGRDPLTKEVHLLQEVLAGLKLENRVRGGNSPLPKGDETIPDSFTMPDEVVTFERPTSGSRGTSAVEQARLSSRGSVQLLTDNAIRHYEHDSSALRRLGSGAFDQVSDRHLREQGVNTHKVPVRHLIITHRVKHDLDHGLRRDRAHHRSFLSDGRPPFQPFRLKSTTEESRLLLDIDSVPHLGSRDDARRNAFDGAAMRATIHGQETEESVYHEQKQRRTVGGKRGRLTVVGRSLYSRGRVHFRPQVHYHSVAKNRSLEENSPPAEQRAPEHVRQDAAIMTDEQDLRTAINVAAADTVADNELNDDYEEEDDSPPAQCTRKLATHKKVPFLGPGGSSTFSIAGNQQQIMKVTSNQFQEWLPLVGGIIYDSRCKDYAQALRRDLTRQKRAHSEQIRLLQADLEECRNDSERQEVRDDIARLKQQWTGKHDRVLSTLNEHISKGGVWSKVQQLRTIYTALIS